MMIAERWWARRSFADGVTRLWEPHVHPLIRCNVWHVSGRSRDLVIDTGTGVTTITDELQDLIQKPVIAVATHIHHDHVGGLHEFSERAMHRLEAPRMTDYQEFAPMRRSEFNEVSLEYLDAIGMGVDGDTLLDAIPHPGYDVATHAIVSTTPTRTLADGDGIDLGDRHFEILHVPGHSPGSIALWEDATRTLYSGDAVYDGAIIDVLDDSDVNDYIATMQRLRQVPAETVHPGHEESFGPERLVEIVDEYLESRT